MPLKVDLSNFKWKNVQYMGTPQHITCNLLNEGSNNHSLFIQSKPHTQRHKKGCKTETCNGTTNKIMPSHNNKQSAICH